MRVYRRNERNDLIDAAVEPDDLVFLFSPSAPPVVCPLPQPPPPDADYIVRDSHGWYYATDGVSGLRYASGHPLAGDTPPYGFPDRGIRR